MPHTPGGLPTLRGLTRFDHSPLYAPCNTLNELMHLSFGQLIGFGIRFGVVLTIAQIIALIVITLIVIVVVAVLTLLGTGVANLFFGNLTT